MDLQEFPPSRTPGCTEIPLDPYRYIINLESKEPPIESFDASTRLYLRLLGRSEELEIRKSGMNQETLAKEELLAGWWILKDSRYPPPGLVKRGVFLSPETITPAREALKSFPTMPWIYNLSATDFEDDLSGPTCISKGRDEDDTSPYDFSPYVRPSRDLFLTNAIVPLPPNCIDEKHELFPELIERCWGVKHPLRILAQEPHITEQHGEEIILITRDLSFGQEQGAKQGVSRLPEICF